MTKKTIALLAIIFSMVHIASAQNEVEMADVMRSNGKIYVVVAVAAIVLFGLIGYLISIDRKLSKIEKEVNRKNIN